MSATALTMERLSFAYGKAPILAGLDLAVAAGTITGDPRAER